MKLYAILFDGLLVCDRSGHPVRFETRRQAEARIVELHIGAFATVTELQAEKDVIIPQVRALRPYR